MALKIVTRLRHRGSLELESGLCYINAGTTGAEVSTPFGGWKNSGLGREECLEELLSYTQNKAIHIFV